MVGINVTELAKLLGPITERWPGCTVGLYGTTYQVRDAQGVDMGQALRAAAALAGGK